MSTLRRIIQRVKFLHRTCGLTGNAQLQQLTPHTLKDIGVDPMAAEHQRNQRLWQELAS